MTTRTKGIGLIGSLAVSALALAGCTPAGAPVGDLVLQFQYDDREAMAAAPAVDSAPGAPSLVAAVEELPFETDSIVSDIAAAADEDSTMVLWLYDSCTMSGPELRVEDGVVDVSYREIDDTIACYAPINTAAIFAIQHDELPGEVILDRCHGIHLKDGVPASGEAAAYCAA